MTLADMIKTHKATPMFRALSKKEKKEQFYKRSFMAGMPLSFQERRKEIVESMLGIKYQPWHAE